MTDEYDDILKHYREKIDSLDKEIVPLLVEREKIIREVASVKKINNIPSVLPERVNEVRDNAVEIAHQLEGDKQYMREIYTKIIQLSCEIEENI